jgi:hypothetical protein
MPTRVANSLAVSKGVASEKAVITDRPVMKPSIRSALRAGAGDAAPRLDGGGELLSNIRTVVRYSHKPNDQSKRFVFVTVTGGS